MLEHDNRGYREPVLNVDLLDKTMDHIRQLEAFAAEGLVMDERWDQGTWGIQGETCGTAMCFAGWACQLAGKNVVRAEKASANGRFHLTIEEPDGHRRAIAEVAADLLGLNDEEDGELFEADNTLNVLEDTVRAIKDGAYR